MLPRSEFTTDSTSNGVTNVTDLDTTRTNVENHLPAEYVVQRTMNPKLVVTKQTLHATAVLTAKGQVSHIQDTMLHLANAQPT